MNLNFDASNHQPQSFDLIDPGWRNIIMIGGEEKPTAKNNGDSYYAAQFELIDGKGQGRKLFHNFNFNNSNDDAKRIAYDQLAAIMHAVGLLKIDRMEQLFNKPMQGKVAIKKATMEEDGVTEKYEARNELKGFKAIEAGGAAAGPNGGLPAGFTAQATATPAAAAAKPAAIPTAAATPAAAAAPTKKLVMTAKAGGGTAEQFRAHDPAWTDDLLVEQGYAEWVEVAAAATSTPAAIPTPATPAQAAEPEAAAAADEDTPPWLQNQ